MSQTSTFLPVLTMKRGKEAPLRYRHPWVFRGALETVPADLAPGAIVDVVDGAGRFLGRGYANPRSEIVVRILTFDAAESVDDALLERKLRRCMQHRLDAAFGDTDAIRWVFGEADGLPGLIVDGFAGFLVVQISTLGMDQFKPAITRILAELFQPKGIYERSDMASRTEHEGLESAVGVLWGQAPPEEVLVKEHGAKFLVSIPKGHKTGFYVDQRENRQRVAGCCEGAQVLDAFCFTGGFGIHARLHGAAHVTHVDSSATALEAVKQNLQANDLSEDAHTFLKGDALPLLRRLHEQGHSYDVVILDPPKFAQTKTHLAKATRGYKEVNLSGMRLLRPGGILATFSCSGAVGPELFQHLVHTAAADLGRDVQVLEYLSQDADHPVLLSFPESHYLKGILCRVW